MFTMRVDKKIELALVQPSFAVEYLRLLNLNLEFLSQWLAWPNHIQEVSDFTTFIQQSLVDYANGKSLTCAIIFDGDVVGNISFNSIDSALGKVEIGYWLAQDFCGKGIVSCSVAYLIDYAFEQLKMEKVQISAAVENMPSRRVCERLGFELEGIITRAENLNGRVVDHAVYGLTKKAG
ncbi:GNAT family protein [Vibrio sp. FNV 38]|nr:GNAT family protein [Vibrio sp. FNV 38]